MQTKADAAVARTRAMATAMTALAHEFAAGTIRRTEAGDLVVHNAANLRPAYPEIQPAVHAAVTFAETCRNMKSAALMLSEQVARDYHALEQEKQDLATEWAAVGRLRKVLETVLHRVRKWLMLPNMPRKIAAEGMELLRDGEQALQESDGEAPEVPDI